MTNQETYELSNGVRIPRIGLGTYLSADEVASFSVKEALQAGYRLVDTAAAYGNERGVGQGVRISGVPREDVFVTSKLRNGAHGYESTFEAFDMTLEKLGLRYLDLYLIHWPNPIQYRPIWQKALVGTWKAMEELYRQGRIKAIGVSNFLPHHIELLRKECSILPMVNQLRLAPGVTQPETAAYCRENGILCEAYSPLGRGLIFRSEDMKVLAAKYKRTVGQVCLRFCVQNGWVPLPKSSHAERIRENLDIFDFELSREDMDFIAGMTGVCGQAPGPDQITF